LPQRITAREGLGNRAPMADLIIKMPHINSKYGRGPEAVQPAADEQSRNSAKVSRASRSGNRADR
jgi:hypothetical protein